MPRKKNFTDTQFEGHELCDTPHQFSKNYVRTIVDLVDIMTARHSKVLVARMDLRYPQEYQSDGSNQDFSSTMQAVCRDFSRKKYDPQYVAKREQVTSSNPHYHIGIVLDGNKKRSIPDIRVTLEKHWADQLGIPLEEVQAKELVYPCNKAPDGTYRSNGRMIVRNTCDTRSQTTATIRQLSYLGKVDNQDITPKGVKKFFSSQFYKDYEKATEKRRYWAEQKNRKLS